MGSDGHTTKHAVLSIGDQSTATTQLTAVPKSGAQSKTSDLPVSDDVVPTWLHGHVSVKRKLFSPLDATCILTSQLKTLIWGETTIGRLVSHNTINDPSTKNYKAGIAQLLPKYKFPQGVTFLYNFSFKENDSLPAFLLDAKTGKYLLPNVKGCNLWSAKGTQLRSIQTAQNQSFVDLVKSQCNNKPVEELLRAGLFDVHSVPRQPPEARGRFFANSSERFKLDAELSPRLENIQSQLQKIRSEATDSSDVAKFCSLVLEDSSRLSRVSYIVARMSGQYALTL